MSQNQNAMKIAVLSETNIENINIAQANIKTMDEKDVVLVAYEKIKYNQDNLVVANKVKSAVTWVFSINLVGN